MKKLKQIFIGVLLLITDHSMATESPEGSWKGALEVAPGKKLALVFHIKQEDNGYSAKFDVPQQKQFGIPFSSVIVEGKDLSLELAAANMKFTGVIKQTTIKGEYSQNGFKAPLVLKPTQEVVTRKQRQQEPQGALPYTTEEITFVNEKANIKLAGTISTPNSAPKATVILISGSGPTNRDADIAGHKFFLVLADQLARQNIAVLRYDDRGVGESNGDHSKATSADFATDAYAALQFLRAHPTLKDTPIGYVGHSEGGLIATIAEANYPAADFMVSLAGLGTSGAQILIDQSYHIQKLMGMDEASLAKDDLLQKSIMAAIQANKNKAELKSILIDHGENEGAADAKAELYMSKWFNFFVKADPVDDFRKLKLPILALNGSLDSQVLARQNIDGFKSAISEELLTTKIFAGLNHLFQPAKTGLPNEYASIETTISVSVSNEISQWIESLNKYNHASL